MWFRRVGWGWNIEKLLEDFSWNNSEFCAWIKRVLRIQIYQRPKQGTYVIRFVATRRTLMNHGSFNKQKYEIVQNHAYSMRFFVHILYIDLIYSLISPKKNGQTFPTKICAFLRVWVWKSSKIVQRSHDHCHPLRWDEGDPLVSISMAGWNGETRNNKTKTNLASGKSRGRLVTFWNLVIFENFALSSWIIKGKMPIVWVSGEFLVLQKMLMNFRNT